LHFSTNITILLISIVSFIVMIYRWNQITTPHLEKLRSTIVATSVFVMVFLPASMITLQIQIHCKTNHLGKLPMDSKPY
jgi:hypothetical protein